MDRVFFRLYIILFSDCICVFNQNLNITNYASKQQKQRYLKLLSYLQFSNMKNLKLSNQQYTPKYFSVFYLYYFSKFYFPDFQSITYNKSLTSKDKKKAVARDGALTNHLLKIHFVIKTYRRMLIFLGLEYEVNYYMQIDINIQCP